MTEFNLNETSISNEIQMTINNKLKENYPFTKTSLNIICSNFADITESIIFNRSEAKIKVKEQMNNIPLLQAILFVCCAWNKMELCEFSFLSNL